VRALIAPLLRFVAGEGANAGKCWVLAGGTKLHAASFTHRRQRETIAADKAAIVKPHCACEQYKLRTIGRWLLHLKYLSLTNLDKVHEVKICAIGYAVVLNSFAGFTHRWGHHLNDIIGCVPLSVFLR
jgi:hypothetical protein